MNKREIVFGPFFTPDLPARQASLPLEPLGLAVEWATPRKATQIPLFRYRSPYLQDRIRLEQIVFNRCELPCDVECPEYQVICAPEGTFLPVSPLLARLYQTFRIARSVFQLLDEFAAAMP